MSAETIELSFITGTWYTITMPAAKVDDPEYDPEELYDKYWNGGLPEDVDVSEGDVDHYWDDQIKP